MKYRQDVRFKKEFEMEWKSKILIFGFILTYMVVPIVEARDELTMNQSLRPYSRILYVGYSSGDQTYSGSDKIVATAIETKSDTIIFYPHFVDFLAIRYPGSYTCATGACPSYNDSQFRYFVNSAHNRNISVWLAVNPIEIKPYDAIKQCYRVEMKENMLQLIVMVLILEVRDIKDWSLHIKNHCQNE